MKKLKKRSKRSKRAPRAAKPSKRIVTVTRSERTTFGRPLDETCVRTSSGKVVCGEPVRSKGLAGAERAPHCC